MDSEKRIYTANPDTQEPHTRLPYVLILVTACALLARPVKEATEAYTSPVAEDRQEMMDPADVSAAVPATPTAEPTEAPSIFDPYKGENPLSGFVKEDE